MTVQKSTKQALISLALSAVAVTLSVISYLSMMNALAVTSVFGYTQKVIPHCVSGITCGGVALIAVVVSAVVYTASITTHTEQCKNGTKSVLTVILSVITAVSMLTALTLSLSAVFGCIGFLG